MEDNNKRKAAESVEEAKPAKPSEEAATGETAPTSSSATTDGDAAAPSSPKRRRVEQGEQGEEEASAEGAGADGEGSAAAAGTRGEGQQEEEYNLRWDRFGEFGSGYDTGVHELVGSTQAIYLCDALVHPSLVARGRRLLDAVAPREEGNEAEEEEDHGDDDADEKELAKEEELAARVACTSVGRGKGGKGLGKSPYEGTPVPRLPPLDVSVGPWREDAEESRRRAGPVLHSPEQEGGFMGAGEDTEQAVHVYRASATVKDAEGREVVQRDRFELTHIFTGLDREYVIVLDKVERRYVFVGEDGCHPHCGTNEYIYDNSDGSGPGLFDDERPPPTPTALLTAARKRFVQFCRNRFH